MLPPGTTVRYVSTGHRATELLVPEYTGRRIALREQTTRNRLRDPTSSTVPGMQCLRLVFAFLSIGAYQSTSYGTAAPIVAGTMGTEAVVPYSRGVRVGAYQGTCSEAEGGGEGERNRKPREPAFIASVSTGHRVAEASEGT
eukprot:3940818-Rhodomonas_salina.2